MLNPVILLCLCIVFLGGFADVAADYGGSISLMGAGTLATAGLSLLLWLRQARIPRAARFQTGFAVFLLLALLMVPFSTPSASGAQNLAVFAAMASLIYNTARVAGEVPDLHARLRRALLIGLGISSAAYAALLVRDGLGSNTIIGARAFGIVAVLGIAHLAVGWRYGSRREGVAALVLLALIAASLSRTTLAVGLAALLLAWIPVGRGLKPWLRFSVAAAAVAAAAWGVWTYVPGLQERFLTGDTSALSVGGVGINAEGRVNFWTVAWNSYVTAPALGQGAGSVERVMLAAYGDQRISHPHNDYLRLLHDYGVIGAGLWLITWFGTMVQMYRRWRTAHGQGEAVTARLTGGVWLALVAVSLVMLTDNIIIYPFAMLPLAVMLGAALAASRSAQGEVADEHVPVPVSDEIIIKTQYDRAWAQIK